MYSMYTLAERKQEEVSKWIRALSLLYSQAYSTQKPHVMKRFHREKYTMPYYGGHMECTFLTENVPLHVAFVCFRLVNKVIGIFLAISNIVWELNQSLIIITLSGMFWVVQCTIVHCFNISLGSREISWWSGMYKPIVPLLSAVYGYSIEGSQPINTRFIICEGFLQNSRRAWILK